MQKRPDRKILVNQRTTEQRHSNLFTAKFILIDSRQSDRRKGLANDLTRGFIQALITSGCVYCGETQIRMTLDRIDNDKGHTQDNVVPACIRCNYTRKDMPYEAWLRVARGMREAREAGLFNGWTGRVQPSPSIPVSFEGDAPRRGNGQ